MRLQFKCRGQTFDKFQYKACTIPLSLSMDMNFCQSLEILCLNFLKSAEFENEGERERSGGGKKRTGKKNVKVGCRHEKCHYLFSVVWVSCRSAQDVCLDQTGTKTGNGQTRVARGQQPQRKQKTDSKTYVSLQRYVQRQETHMLCNSK